MAECASTVSFKPVRLHEWTNFTVKTQILQFVYVYWYTAHSFLRILFLFSCDTYI